MKKFMDDDFLLECDTAKELYEKYAAMSVIPVIDYHCHIDPKEIYEDRRFKNITEAWLGGDHYKWRQMRTDGIDEKYITGDADDREKFFKWAQVMPHLSGNPLYHWSHLELKHYFGFTGNLNPDTAHSVWDLCERKLADEGFSARGLIKKSNVSLICTTDDPADDLVWHEKIAADDSFDVQVLPTWRPDRIIDIKSPSFNDYLQRLEDVCAINTGNISTLKNALIRRMDYFEEHGCRISDHGMEYVPYSPASEDEIEKIFKKALSGEAVSKDESDKYRTYMMLFFAKEYNRRGWAMQLHFGCSRNNNSLMFEKLGPDTGFDCISEKTGLSNLTGFLDDLYKTDSLPKTVIYSLDPNDDRAIGTIIGCFQGGGIRSRIQHGSAWWFNDNLTGMRDQMTSLAAQSAFGNFIGMLTDSRSFLSYTRHDYFRRILCSLVGGWVESGQYPDDEKLLANLIKGIAYNNAVRYFGFKLPQM